jgi:hypothetical protein
MKKVVSFAVLCAVFSVPAFACEKPAAPASIPDGKKATKEEMLAAKKEVDTFKQAMDEYVTCEKNVMRAESAQEEMMKVADRFNAQIRLFKART